MSRGNRIYEEMQAIAKVIAADPETKDRYDKATKGGREWFCFSRWVAEDRTRWKDPDAVEYRDSLTSWLGSLDIVYVLQFETNTDVVAYLKNRLVAAINRETSKGRLHLKACLLELGLGFLVSEASYYAGQCGGRLSSVYRARADYLRGQSPGASHWTHPDCRLYLEWYNRYDAPTSGAYRVQ